MKVEEVKVVETSGKRIEVKLQMFFKNSYVAQKGAQNRGPQIISIFIILEKEIFLWHGASLHVGRNAVSPLQFYWLLCRPLRLFGLLMIFLKGHESLRSRLLAFAALLFGILKAC